MKKIISLLTTFTIVLGLIAGIPITANASTTYTEGHYTYTVENKEATITDYNSLIYGEISIPTTLGGYPVKKIGYRAFADCDRLTSISIPGNITEIGNVAFGNCSSLESINLPYGVRTIGGSAFQGCEKLKSITLPNSLTTIGQYAFYDCTSLESIVIPKSVTFFDSYAFVNCTKLENVEFLCDIDQIGNYMFRNCTNLKIVKISGNIKTLKSYAFYECTSLTNITIPKSITNIESGTFFYCTGLTNIEVDNDNLSYCDVDGILYSKDMSALICYPCGRTSTNFNVPNNVLTINSNAFAYCDALQTVNMTNNISEVGMSAFEYCANLREINLPNSIRTIAQSTFSNCTSLKSITIPDTVTTIDRFAFLGCNALSNIVMSNSVKTVNASAFNGCSSLNEITFIGSKEDYNSINVDVYNDYFKNATVIYTPKVKIYNFDETILSDKTQDIDTIVDLSAFIEDGYICNIYTDKEKTNIFDITTSITGNMVLYADIDNIIKIDSFNLSNPKSVTVREVFTVTPYMAIEKDANYMYYMMSYPESLTLKEITSKAFSLVTKEDETTLGGITTLALLCQNSSALPKNQVVVPFELSFEVSKNATIGTIDLLIDESTCYIGDDAYQFLELTSSNLIIEPKLAESISIIGQDTITGTSTYTISVLPDYATHQVVWSVDKTEIAEVDTNGVVTPKKSGTIILTASTTDGSNLTATKEITISMRARLTSVISDIGEWDKIFDSDITEYIVYVDKDTSKIKFTSKCVAGAKLTVNNETAIPNIAKSIDLDKDTTLISIKISGVADCEDNTYTFTIIKKKPRVDATVSSDGKSFVISPKYIENGNLVILALYNGDKFVKLYDAIYQGQDIPFNNIAETYDKVKIMVWSDFETLIPICEVNDKPTVIE